MTAADASAAPNSTCLRCGASFRCGALDPQSAAQAQPCWCMAFPPVASPTPGATCWCPACLAAQTGLRNGAAQST